MASLPLNKMPHPPSYIAPPSPKSRSRTGQDTFFFFFSFAHRILSTAASIQYELPAYLWIAYVLLFRRSRMTRKMEDQWEKRKRGVGINLLIVIAIPAYAPAATPPPMAHLSP
ncbi:hypothetical protein LY78DRAFT_347609 [Colletotrichum sublineola]|nr:hypothetical protein LY78DRAFT_347609 [Colletotrichum sublineola]